MSSVSKPYFFVSYSRRDSERVLEIVRRLQEAKINLWVDQFAITPGERWDSAIDDALRSAIGLIIFLSSHSTASEYVRDELSYAMANGGAIVPVLLEDTEIPFRLANTQYIDLRDGNRATESVLIERLKSLASTANVETKLKDSETRFIAREVAEEIRKKETSKRNEIPPESVFIVHGHDVDLLEEIETYLIQLGVEPVVLSKMDNKHNSLFQKFLAWGGETRFAIVLITADDVGAGRFQFDAPNVGAHSLQFRARQNVILELGFFYGYLGWENVFVLFKKPDRVFPNFERPSDLDGVLFEEVDDTDKWKKYLRERLEEAGFQLK